MAVWLIVYGAGFIVTTVGVAFAAHSRRGLHEMAFRTVTLLTLCSGLIWPLLAFAGVQIAGLLIVKTALGLLRGSGDEAIATVDATPVLVLEPLAVAAA